MTTDFTPTEHIRYLAEFLGAEQSINGPDGHLVTLGPLLAGESLEERIWRCGLYAAVYNVPTAEALWRAFPYERVARHPDNLEYWLERHWSALSIRRERRAVRTPRKMRDSLLSYLDWMATDRSYWADEGAYESAWRSTGVIYGMGRYIRIKLLEAFHRHADAAWALNDIRAAGGRSPRSALAMLYPGQAHELLGGDSKGNVTVAEMCARWAREELDERYHVPASMFELQVALCEYKSSYNRNQYPGRTLDSELAHWEKVRVLGHESRFLEARRLAFPAVALGEHAGWSGRREALHDVLRDFRYTWSDLTFDYVGTTDLASPVRWDVSCA